MKKSGIFFLFIVLLVAGVFLSGCTSTNNTAGTPVLPASSTVPPATIMVVDTTVSPQPLTSVPTTMITPTQIPGNSGMNVTINSVKQETDWAGNKPPAGYTFLVLDVTLNNNDDKNSFVYTPSSFEITGNLATSTKHPAAILSSDFSGSVTPNSQETGMVIFDVKNTATLFKFFLNDPSGNVITEVDNIAAS
jgi:hypothetical protein